MPAVPEQLTQEYLEAKVAEALEEDGVRNDLTTGAVVAPDLQAQAELVAKAAGVVAGLTVAETVFRQVDPSLEFTATASDGAVVRAGAARAQVRGRLTSLLRGERVALNFLQQLSGVATLTHSFVEAAGGSVAVLDTRKTAPGLRPLQRYAVRAGGGANHRFNLADSVLVKDNHVAAAGGVAAAIRRARRTGLPVEVEVESVADLLTAIDEGAEAVLLDNMSPAGVADAVRLTAGRTVLEVSGGVTVASIAAYAATGVERISVGALTHSAPALDISMEVTPDMPHVGPTLASPSVTDMQEEIRRLARARNAVILAHNYQRPEVQDVADLVGDSLGLSREAARTDADLIVFCGVHFMAETAAILNPDKRVLLPDPDAGCSLADTIDADQLRAWKARHPGAVVVSYVNTTAEVKAESDYCCTSGNARAVIEAIPEDQTILFAPDLFLGGYLERVTGRRMQVWPGECHVHAGIRPADLEGARREHGDADLLVHPECGCASSCMYFAAGHEVEAARTHVLSTEGMVDHVRSSPRTEFVVATETGILHRLRKEVPDLDKRFFAVSERAICRYMKMVTLDKVLRSLREDVHPVSVPAPVAARARLALTRMVQIG